MEGHMKELSLGVYIASYKGADTCTTHNLLEYSTYVVRKSEEEEYRANGIKNSPPVPCAWDGELRGATRLA